MAQQPSRAHLYKQFSQYEKWLVDFAIDYAAAHRNHDYIQLLLEFGTALIYEAEVK